MPAEWPTYKAIMGTPKLEALVIRMIYRYYDQVFMHTISFSGCLYTNFPDVPVLF
jgi:hypothetical protein